MPDKTLSELPEATALTDNDLFYVVDGTTSKKITKANLESELGGGGGGDVAHIETKSLTTGTQATFDFTSIASTYRHLKIVGLTRAEDFDEAVYFHVQFNGDTAANYDYVRVNIDGAGTVSAVNSNAGRANEAVIGLAEGTFSTVNVSGFFEMLIPFYARTDVIKTASAHSSVQGSDGDTTDFQQVRCTMTWHSASAINRVNFHRSGATNFEADTHFSLYGIT